MNSSPPIGRESPDSDLPFLRERVRSFRTRRSEAAILLALSMVGLGSALLLAHLLLSPGPNVYVAVKR